MYFAQPELHKLGDLVKSHLHDLSGWKTKYAWIWGLFGGSLTAAARWVARRSSPKTMFHSLFEKGDSVYVVMPQLHATTFKSEDTGDPIRLPKDASLLPFGDAMAVQMIADSVRLTFGAKKRSEFQIQRRADVSFISVGGPSVNKTAASAQKQIESTLMVDRKAHSFTLDNSIFVAEGPKDRSALLSEVTVDYGFIVVLAKPNTRVKSVFLWGIWAAGTQAAAKEFLRSDRLTTRERYLEWALPGHSESAQLRAKLRRLFKSGTSLVAVVRAVPIHSASCEAELVKVHAIPPS